MKIVLPDLEFTPEAIVENRKKIQSARAAYQAALKTLAGLDQANSAMCSHADVINHYDPAYAGGGYSHTECKVCGGRVPFRS